MAYHSHSFTVSVAKWHGTSSQLHNVIWFMWFWSSNTSSFFSSSLCSARGKWTALVSVADLSTALHEELQHATQEEDGGGCSCSSLSHGPNGGPTPKKKDPTVRILRCLWRPTVSRNSCGTRPILQIVRGISRFMWTRKYNQQRKTKSQAENIKLWPTEARAWFTRP